MTLAALEREYETDGAAFKQRALDILLPSAIHGTALAARGAPPFNRPQRWACQAALKMAGYLGMGVEVNIALMIAERVGVKSETEAAGLIEAASRARSASPEDSYRLAKSIVRDRVRSDPAEAHRAMQEIFGLIDAPATVAHTNGNGAHA